MADVEVRKGVKRSTSERDDQCSGQEEVHCEEPTSKFEKSEAKRWRCYSDFYNSDTGATIKFAISGLSVWSLYRLECSLWIFNGRRRRRRRRNLLCIGKTNNTHSDVTTSTKVLLNVNSRKLVPITDYLFAVRTVSDWNQLPTVVVEQENPAAFKANLARCAPVRTTTTISVILHEEVYCLLCKTRQDSPMPGCQNSRNHHSWPPYIH